MDLALFDFDGTLTTRETFADFVRRAVSPRRFAIGTVVLAPLVAGYRIGCVSGTRVRAAISRVAFSGAVRAEVEAAGRDYAERVIPGLLRAEAMQRLDWHRTRGDTIAVVSGAFDFYLAPWCRAHSLELLCSSLASVDGVLSGRYRGAQCVLGEKARRVAERFDLDAFDAVHAYGDTEEDRDLLALADHAHYRGQPLPAKQRHAATTIDHGK